ncbi:MAG TPA: FliH/SctL family protein [Defluviitaleaceae bacterium]|nr:hypothetical protein [Candidatus Epulonipiscium sp.]HOQ17606.1 FliH/SctL family protein [Defluviitaleaceae bacterium]HPT75225.1 FliH/SctL family protein [Defluviitaleaceae bacterium]HQD50502.1 FliH/SctL family protein [Defluviitaleaceae bacterium]
MSSIIKGPAVNYNYEQTVQIKANEEFPKEDLVKIDNTSAEIIVQNILEKARYDANKMIHEAEKAAAELLDKARQEAIALKKETEEEAWKEGYEKGLQQGILEGEKIKSQAKEELKKAYLEKERIINEIEPQMVQLIIDILEKLLANSIKTNPQYILYLIRKGFSQVKEGNEKIIIRVSDQDYPLVIESKEELIEDLGINNDIEIIKDSSLSCSDCIIETDFGNIDCSLGVQFEGLKEELLSIKNY